MSLDKIADVAGKSGIVAIPVTEAAEKVGIIMSADLIQWISAAGVLVLIADRVIRLLWDRRDRKAGIGRWARHEED